MYLLCDALTTPELCPVWCGATSRSFSNTATVILGYLLSNSLAVARPTIPPPTDCHHKSVSIRLKHRAVLERTCYLPTTTSKRSCSPVLSKGFTLNLSSLIRPFNLARPSLGSFTLSPGRWSHKWRYEAEETENGRTCRAERVIILVRKGARSMVLEDKADCIIEEKK